MKTVPHDTVNGVCLGKQDKITNTSRGQMCDICIIESTQVFVRERGTGAWGNLEGVGAPTAYKGRGEVGMMILISHRNHITRTNAYMAHCRRSSVI